MGVAYESEFNLSQAASLIGASEPELLELIQSGQTGVVPGKNENADGFRIARADLERMRTNLLMQELIDVLDDPEAWLDMPNPWLAGLCPRELLGTEREQLVRDIIEGIKYGSVA